jgi:hypothetical protein
LSEFEYIITPKRGDSGLNIATRLRILAEGIPCPREPVGRDDRSDCTCCLRIAIGGSFARLALSPRVIVVVVRIASEVVVGSCEAGRGAGLESAAN